MVQSVDLSAVKSASYNGTEIKKIVIDGAEVWVAPPTFPAAQNPGNLKFGVIKPNSSKSPISVSYSFNAWYQAQMPGPYEENTNPWVYQAITGSNYVRSYKASQLAMANVSTPQSLLNCGIAGMSLFVLVDVNSGTPYLATPNTAAASSFGLPTIPSVQWREPSFGRVDSCGSNCIAPKVVYSMAMINGENSGGAASLMGHKDYVPKLNSTGILFSGLASYSMVAPPDSTQNRRNPTEGINDASASIWSQFADDDLLILTPHYTGSDVDPSGYAANTYNVGTRAHIPLKPTGGWYARSGRHEVQQFNPEATNQWTGALIPSSGTCAYTVIREDEVAYYYYQEQGGSAAPPYSSAVYVGRHYWDGETRSIRSETVENAQTSVVGEILSDYLTLPSGQVIQIQGFY